MATQAQPALADFDPTAEQARAAWMAPGVPEAAKG
jgi:hypothetical protein